MSVDLETVAIVDINKKYKFFIEPMKEVKFNIKFSPKLVKHYSFQLPVEILGYGSIPGIERNILCRGVKPKFLI